MDMEIIRLNKFEDLKENEKLSLVLGFFDGVHIGHVQLINFARASSPNKLGVLTFDKAINKGAKVLTSLEDKLAIFASLNVDVTYVVHVDENFSKILYQDFVELILKKINPVKIFCGPDFRYGYKAQGDVNYLKERIKEVYVLNYVKDHNGNKISSSSIKKLIEEGHIYDANRWLGRVYKIRGKVVSGKGIGRSFGFPTANLETDVNYVIPKEGVYITSVTLGKTKHKALTNIGTNPTISSNNKQTIETYIIDFKDELYGQDLEISFFSRLRDEIKFDSEDKLIEQLEKDMDDATYYFNYVKSIQ